LGKNIHDAFFVVRTTLENAGKLLDYCRSEAQKEDSEFIPASYRILHDKYSDTEFEWCLYNFILVFQESKNKQLPNEWRNGPVYALEINFNTYDYDEPTVTLAKYVYAKGALRSWSKGLKHNDFGGFLYPLYDEDTIEFQSDELSFSGIVIDKSYADSNSRSLRRIVGIQLPLAEITREDAKNGIFGGFRSLIDK